MKSPETTIPGIPGRPGGVDIPTAAPVIGSTLASEPSNLVNPTRATLIKFELKACVSDKTNKSFPSI